MLEKEIYIAIEADINDGDYVTEIKTISNDNLLKLKDILNKMPKSNKSIRYETGDIGDDDVEDSEYKYISTEEKIFLGEYLPYGDENYSGIHTITNITVFEKIEKLL